MLFLSTFIRIRHPNRSNVIISNCFFVSNLENIDPSISFRVNKSYLFTAASFQKNQILTVHCAELFAFMWENTHSAMTCGFVCVRTLGTLCSHLEPRCGMPGRAPAFQTWRKLEKRLTMTLHIEQPRHNVPFYAESFSLPMP